MLRKYKLDISSGERKKREYYVTELYISFGYELTLWFCAKINEHFVTHGTNKAYITYLAPVNLFTLKTSHPTFFQFFVTWKSTYGRLNHILALFSHDINVQ